MADKKVAIVFAGHVHLYNEMNYRGMRQIISAGAGAQPYASAEKGGFFHYLLIKVNDDQISVEVHRL